VLLIDCFSSWYYGSKGLRSGMGSKVRSSTTNDYVLSGANHGEDLTSAALFLKKTPKMCQVAASMDSKSSAIWSHEKRSRTSCHPASA
jgi:hypothetical protein